MIIFVRFCVNKALEIRVDILQKPKPNKTTVFLVRDAITSTVFQ